MSSSRPIYFITPSNADASKCFKWRKRGANKIYWWVFSGKCLQYKYQKYNFIGEDCKAKCAKTWKLVQNVKSVTSSTFESKFVLRIGFIVKAYSSMSSISLIHLGIPYFCNWKLGRFRTTNLIRYRLFMSYLEHVGYRPVATGAMPSKFFCSP